MTAEHYFFNPFPANPSLISRISLIANNHKVMVTLLRFLGVSTLSPFASPILRASKTYRSSVQYGRFKRVCIWHFDFVVREFENFGNIAEYGQICAEF